MRVVTSYLDSSKLVEVLGVPGASGLGPRKLAEALWVAGGLRLVSSAKFQGREQPWRLVNTR